MAKKITRYKVVRKCATADLELVLNTLAVDRWKVEATHPTGHDSFTIIASKLGWKRE
jgi:hypothetical protein